MPEDFSNFPTISTAGAQTLQVSFRLNLWGHYLSARYKNWKCQVVFYYWYPSLTHTGCNLPGLRRADLRPWSQTYCQRGQLRVSPISLYEGWGHPAKPFPNNNKKKTFYNHIVRYIIMLLHIVTRTLLHMWLQVCSGWWNPWQADSWSGVQLLHRPDDWE